jgi:hypothetical protein
MAWIIKNGSWVGLGGIRPLWLKLSHIFLRHNIVIFCTNFLTIFIMVDTLFSVAMNHILTKQPYSLNRHLSLSSTLFDGLRISHRVFRSAALCICITNMMKSREGNTGMGFARGVMICDMTNYLTTCLRHTILGFRTEHERSSKFLESL